ncbi:hypothetical protein CLPU_9c00720 [Gottschalkia purinilytica]|uniref:Uncharacterized protein n=1 Tax=Gottschalkia purinilytica TaxID=1503 RepID=A0A0L0W9Q5_GOTPU|nr:hypothetical protein [Gottschalkia purinilytica]KNF08176.1 hypothetical protein CLPU_9c00720 [Gottschalkia purinilytica]
MILKKLFNLIKKEKEQNNINDNLNYVKIPYSEINEDIKSKIRDLEKSSEELCIKYENKYKDLFEKAGKRNLELKVARDIDGDEIESLTDNGYLEPEYRSMISFYYDDGTEESREFDYFQTGIELWYYSTGYSRYGSGTLYCLTIEELEKEIEEILYSLLNYD